MYDPAGQPLPTLLCVGQNYSIFGGSLRSNFGDRLFDSYRNRIKNRIQVPSLTGGRIFSHLHCDQKPILKFFSAKNRLDAYKSTLKSFFFPIDTGYKKSGNSLF